MTEISVGVFTSALNLRERALSVQRTWLRDFPSGFLLGGKHVDPGLRMLSCGADVGEGYRSALKKQFVGLGLLVERFPAARWFFITGCDAYVYARNLEALLAGYDPSLDWFIGGHCARVEVDGESILYPSGGPGFALSRPLALKVCERAEAFVAKWEGRSDGLRGACDVAMAVLVVRILGRAFTYQEGFYHCQPYRYPGNPYLDGEGATVDKAPTDTPIAFHSLSIREMYQLDCGDDLRRPGILLRAVDYVAKRAARIFRTRYVVNDLCAALWPPRRR